MQRVITFDRGSKRRLNQIRWKEREVFSLVLLATFMLVMSVFVVLAWVQHEHPSSEAPKVPQIRDAQPASP
jgi:hypothetical protein